MSSHIADRGQQRECVLMCYDECSCCTMSQRCVMCSRTGMRSPFVVPGSRFHRIICSFASSLWCLFDPHAFDYSKESYYNIVDICLIGTSTLANFNV